MGSRRLHSVYQFGPSLRKPSIRKGPGKLKKKCLEQLRRTQDSFKLAKENRYNHDNGRGDGNVAKRPQQNKVAPKKTLQILFEGPSHAKVVSRPNASSSLWPNKGTISPRENVEKSKPSFSSTLQKNTQKANNGIDSSQKNTTKSRPSSFMSNSGGASRSNNGIGSSVKNVQSSSRLKNFEAPLSKSTKMHESSYSRPNDEMASQSMKSRPFDFVSNCGSGPSANNIEKSKPSWPRDQSSSVLKDVSNSTFDISKKLYPSSMIGNSRKKDHQIAKEALSSNLALKVKQVMQDIQPNLGINCVSLPIKNLSSHQTVEASCMVDSIDDNRNCKTSLLEDGRTYVYKLKNKRMKPLLEEKFEAHGVARLTKSMGSSIKLDKNTILREDERTVDENKRKSIDNCSHKRRRYVVFDDEEDDDYRTEVSNLSGSESSKPHHYCSLPIDEPIWSGIIKIGSGNFVSLAAHLSTKCCEKVWKLSRSLEPVVEVTKLSRLEAWPKSFDASRPPDDNIAVYLLPTEMRQDADLDQLVKEVMENDIVLRAIVGEAEMLIFPSILLPEQHQTFQGKPYLWAVFRHRNDNVAIMEEQQNCKGRRVQEKGKQQASHFSVGKEGHGLESFEGAEMQGMEQDVNPKLARPNAPSPTASAPNTAAATMSANHGEVHSSLAVPTGALFGFVVQRTARLEQLIHEMQREGAVMVAMQGQMIGPGLGLGRQ